MKAQKSGCENVSLQKKIKNIVLKAKEKNLIKPHTEAFKTYPTKKRISKII